MCAHFNVKNKGYQFAKPDR